MSIFTKHESFKTVAKMRLLALPVADVVYYLSEAGKEGEWYYDAADTTTADNVGMVIVTTVGSYRLKRSMKGSNLVIKSWFTGSNNYFDSVADANATIPSVSRFRGLTVIVNDSGTMTLYWYRDGILDANLVTVALTISVTNGPTTSDRGVFAAVLSPTSLLIKSLGITGTGGIDVTRISSADSEDFVVTGATTGTYSQRPISPVLGQKFYQTDQLEGFYMWDGSKWNYTLDNNTEVWCKFFGNVYPMNANNSGTAGAVTYQDGTQGFSYWAMETGTDPAGYAQIRSSQNTVFGSSTGKTIFSMGNVIIPTLSDGTDSFIVRIGRPAGADGIGFFFKYTHSLGSGQWQMVCHNGTSAFAANSGSAVVAGTPYNLIAVHDFTGTDNVKFYINNVLVSTVGSNLPANFTNGYFGSISIEKTAGTANRRLLIDDLIIKRIP